MASQKFLLVSDETTNENYELPLENDNSLLVSVLDSTFSDATGLKYRNPETGAWRALKVVDGRIISPESGWGSTTYNAVIKKASERKKLEKLKDLLERRYLTQQQYDDGVHLVLKALSEEGSQPVQAAQYADIKDVPNSSAGNPATLVDGPHLEASSTIDIQQAMRQEIGRLKELLRAGRIDQAAYDAAVRNIIANWIIRGKQPVPGGVSVACLQNSANFDRDVTCRKFLRTTGLAPDPTNDSDKASHKPNEDLVCFVRRLRLSTIVDDVLYVGDNVSIGGERDLKFLHGQMFVRECYTELHDILMEEIEKTKATRFLLQGSPGIGKTFFSYYMIYRLMQAKKTIVWQPSGSKDIVCITPEKTFFSDSLVTFLEYLNDKSTWYIVNTKVPMSVEATTLMITSPDTEISQPFAKLGVTKRYMPVWSEAEIKKVYDSRIPLCRQFPELTWPEIEVLYRRWGGIPRHIFQFGRDTDVQATLQVAINAADIDRLCKFISQPSDDEVSNKVLHLDVKTKCPVGDLTFRKYATTSIVFASVFVLDEVVNTMDLRNRDSLVQLLAMDKHEAETTLLRGYLFESVAHKILSAGGPFTIRKLGTKTLSASGKELSTLVLPRSCGTDSCENLDNIEANHLTYYRPVDTTLSAVDSFMFPDRLFQMTIAESRPIDSAEIEDVVKKIFDAQQPNPIAARARRKLDEESATKKKRPSARQTRSRKSKKTTNVASRHLNAGQGSETSSDGSSVVPRRRKEKMELYFVVPESSFQDFKLQPFRRNGQLEDEAQVDVIVVQYVLKLAITSEHC